MVSIEDQKIEHVDYTEPMCIKIAFTTFERGDVIRKYVEQFFTLGAAVPERFVNGALVGGSDCQCRMYMASVTGFKYKHYVSLKLTMTNREQFDRVAAILAERFKIYV